MSAWWMDAVKWPGADKMEKLPLPMPGRGLSCARAHISRTHILKARTLFYQSPSIACHTVGHSIYLAATVSVWAAGDSATISVAPASARLASITWQLNILKIFDAENLPNSAMQKCSGQSINHSDIGMPSMAFWCIFVLVEKTKWLIKLFVRLWMFGYWLCHRKQPERVQLENLFDSVSAADWLRSAHFACSCSSCGAYHLQVELWFIHIWCSSNTFYLCCCQLAVSAE